MDPLPGWIDRGAWEGWKAARRAKKIPWSARCAVRALKRLQELKDAGSDPNACLEQSEFFGWADIYPLRPSPVQDTQKRQDSFLEEHEQARKASQSPEAIAARKRVVDMIRPALKVVGKSD